MDIPFFDKSGRVKRMIPSLVLISKNTRKKSKRKI
jgi:hypothetical protein